MENTYCLNMGSRFNYKYPHRSLQLSVAPVTEDLTPSSTYAGTKQIWIHIFSQNPHILKIWINIKQCLKGISKGSMAALCRLSLSP